MQFVNKLRKRSGTALIATTLLEAPTVAALARLVEPEATSSASSGGKGGVTPLAVPEGRRSGAEAIRIGSGTRGRPIFLIHDGLGEVLLYRTLALKLGPVQPVYGLQPEIRADGSVVHTEIGTMAEAHIAKLKRVQPVGPFILAGLCAGGVLAVEMARQLEAAGETVLFVGIIDAADVEARERPFFVARLRLKRFAHTLEAPGALHDRVGQMARKARNLLLYEAAERVRQTRMRKTVHRLRAQPLDQEAAAPAKSSAPRSPAFLDVYKVAHREHRPRGVLRGPDVVLYRATQGTGAPDDMPFFEQFSDCALGWGLRVEEDLQIVPIGGGHVSALQEPHVSGLARAMRDGIDAAMARAEERDRANPPVIARGESASIEPHVTQMVA